MGKAGSVPCAPCGAAIEGSCADCMHLAHSLEDVSTTDVKEVSAIILTKFV